MCESTVYIEEGGERTEFMKEVAKIDVTGNKYVLRDILGNEKELENVELVEINLVGHGIVFQKK